MKKKILTLTIFICVVMALQGCSGGLPEGFDQEKITQEAKTVVETINSLSYEDVVKLIREDLREQVKAQDLQSAWGDKLSAAGEFIEYKNIAYASSQGGTENYGVVVINCVYENDSATFTLMFDKNYELVGLYMK